MTHIAYARGKQTYDIGYFCAMLMVATRIFIEERHEKNDADVEEGTHFLFGRSTMRKIPFSSGENGPFGDP